MLGVAEKLRRPAEKGLRLTDLFAKCIVRLQTTLLSKKV
jgi:hypothetical protein